MKLLVLMVLLNYLENMEAMIQILKKIDGYMSVGISIKKFLKANSVFQFPAISTYYKTEVKGLINAR